MSNEIVEIFKKLIGKRLLGHPVHVARHWRNLPLRWIVSIIGTSGFRILVFGGCELKKKWTCSSLVLISSPNSNRLGLGYVHLQPNKNRRRSSENKHL